MSTGEGADRVVVTVWNDYICPWAYAARPHTDWLRTQGIVIRPRSYELHPAIGPEGRRTRPGGRLDQVFEHIADECATLGLPFVKPQRTPNSRRSLELIELIALHHPDAFQAIDSSLANAHWVEGAELDDLHVLESITADSLGADAAAQVHERLANGEGSRLLEESKVEALDVGVTATPAWRIGEMTITGLHPPEQFQRWAGRLLGLEAPRPASELAHPTNGKPHAG